MKNVKNAIAVETKNAFYKEVGLDFIEKIKNDFKDEEIKKAIISGIVDVSVVVIFKSGLSVTMFKRFNDDKSVKYEEYGSSNLNLNEANRIHSYKAFKNKVSKSPYKISYTRKV